MEDLVSVDNALADLRRRGRARDSLLLTVHATILSSLPKLSQPSHLYLVRARSVQNNILYLVLRRNSLIKL